MTPMEQFAIAAPSALKFLEPRERQALRHKLDGHTRRETAIAMGLKPQTVRRMWQTIREKLRAAVPLEQFQKFSAMLSSTPTRPREVRAFSLSDCVGV